MMLAARGAKVVVNDLGSSLLGEGNSVNAADQTVEAIVQVFSTLGVLMSQLLGAFSCFVHSTLCAGRRRGSCEL